MRYSGVSLGYQVTSIVAGSLASIIAVRLLETYKSAVTISWYLAATAAVSALAVAAARDEGHRPGGHRPRRRPGSGGRPARPGYAASGWTRADRTHRRNCLALVDCLRAGCRDRMACNRFQTPVRQLRV